MPAVCGPGRAELRWLAIERLLQQMLIHSQVHLFELILVVSTVIACSLSFKVCTGSREVVGIITIAEAVKPFCLLTSGGIGIRPPVSSVDRVSVAGVSELGENIDETLVLSGQASSLGGVSGTESGVHDVSPVRLAVGRTIATHCAQMYQGIVEDSVLSVGQDFVLESSELSVESIWFTIGPGVWCRIPWVPWVPPSPTMAQHTGVLIGLKTEILSAQVAAALVAEHASSRRRAEVTDKVRAWDVAGLQSHQAVRLR